MTKKVVVAGAGVFGSCIALALARAGLEVTVADPADLGDNASGVAAGMLAPAFESVFDERPEHFAQSLAARDLWPDFAASMGVKVERHGAVAVSFESEKVEAWRRALAGLGVVASPLTSAQIAAAHPGLAPGLSGVAVDTEWRLDPLQALGAITVESERLGVAFRREALASFSPGRAELADGSIIGADALVVATGASTTLLGLAPELAELTPIKGHILRYPDLVAPGPVIRFDGGYICPAPDGLRVGATMEPGRYDTAIHPSEVGKLQAMGARYWPALGTSTLRANAGVRGATSNGQPIVGRSADPGVWLAVGARRNGWLLAPMVARSIVAGIIGG